MKVAAVNMSKGYNLGIRKLRNWLLEDNHEVDLFDDPKSLDLDGYDLIALSVIFSWDAVRARDIANKYKNNAEIWCGGPGIFALKNWWKKETGLDCVSGLDWRFERQRGHYEMVFASRGCPVDCSFCIVPRIEGTEITLDWGFVPAPVLCDNNLSALPSVFQNHIIKKYRHYGVVLEDAKSGFEPRTFTEETYRRWKSVIQKYWRFAFDTTSEEEYVRSMMKILGDVPSYNKRVYVLLGNEPISACYERVMKVIEWGGEPYCQPMIALNALEKVPIVRYDWNKTLLQDMARWANRWVWRKTPLKEYKNRKYEPAPFAHIGL